MSYEVDAGLVNSFPPELYAEYCRLFKEFDKNNNAVIEKSEFKDLLKELGFTELSKKEVKALFKDIDLNNDNVISFYEFLQIMKKMKS